MNRQTLRFISRLILLVIISVVFLFSLEGCSPENPEIIGTWRNARMQQLSVGLDSVGLLTGQLTQSSTCGPVLDMDVHRGPYDGYSFRFALGSLVSIPEEQLPSFPGFSVYCSSDDSKPMCRFCEIDGDVMTCESPEQGLERAPAKVVHNCNWTRISPMPSALPPPPASCPPPPLCIPDPGTPPTTN